MIFIRRVISFSHGDAAKWWSDKRLGRDPGIMPQGSRGLDGELCIVRHAKQHSGRLFILLTLAPLIAGCSGASDLMSKDAEWFSRPGRLFIRNVSIDAPPLNPNTPVAADDLVSAEGACPGMNPPPGTGDAQALADGPAGAPSAPAAGGTVALGHTECDVVRGVGAPDSVNLSSNARGERQAVVTWTHGPHAGIYTFTAGRLSSIDRAPEPVAPPKVAKPKAKKKAAT
jgi:hypothetical protein